MQVIVILTIINVVLTAESCDKSDPGCEMKSRISKCCPIGMVLDMSLFLNDTAKASGTVCRRSSKDFNPPVYDGSTVLKQSAVELLDITTALVSDCQKKYNLFPASSYTDFKLLKNGNLFINASVTTFLLDSQYYCIDYFIEDSEQTDPQLDALICLKHEYLDPQSFLVTGTCMLVSCVFILLTLSVYIYISKYDKLHEKIFLIYLSCLFVGFLLVGSMQLIQYHESQSVDLCLALTFHIYFAFLSIFSWLTVMCYDMWRNFIWRRNKIPSRESVRAKLLVYALPGFGIPALLTILLIIMEFSNVLNENVHPMLRVSFEKMHCFLAGMQLLYYLYTPITIFCVANCIFFTHILIHIVRSIKQASAFKSKESCRHGQQSRQPLSYCVRLFILMGINWILESLSAYYQDKNWVFVDYYNGLIGVIIFLAFVCRQQIYQKIKEKFLNGRVTAPSREVSRTTHSRNTSETAE